MGRRKDPAGDYDDWISNITGEDEIIIICNECGNYIRNDIYWQINEEVLCDDCARAKYQRGVMGRYDVY